MSCRRHDARFNLSPITNGAARRRELSDRQMHWEIVRRMTNSGHPARPSSSRDDAWDRRDRTRECRIVFEIGRASPSKWLGAFKRPE